MKLPPHFSLLCDFLVKNLHLKTISIILVHMGEDYEAMGEDGSSSSSKRDNTPKQTLLLFRVARETFVETLEVTLYLYQL